MKVLAIGEAMVELSPIGEDRFAMGFAGDTFNTAWYLRQVAGPGIDIAYMTAIGDDAMSARLAQFITNAGIEPVLTRRTGRSVGLYAISLTNGERSFSYWRDSSAARTLADDLETLPLTAGDLAYFSGITLAILPIEGRQRLLAALAKAREAGAHIAFDPNLRPRLWETTREMCDWVMEGAALADLCLPSFDDEAAYFGDASPMATAQRYGAAGTRKIVVKNGPGPVVICKDGQFTEFQPMPVTEIVDTTAAGDSFNAQYIAAWLAGADDVAATRAACALAAKVIGAKGALVP